MDFGKGFGIDRIASGCPSAPDPDGWDKRVGRALRLRALCMAALDASTSREDWLRLARQGRPNADRDHLSDFADQARQSAIFALEGLALGLNAHAVVPDPEPNPADHEMLVSSEALTAARLFGVADAISLEQAPSRHPGAQLDIEEVVLARRAEDRVQAAALTYYETMGDTPIGRASWLDAAMVEGWSHRLSSFAGRLFAHARTLPADHPDRVELDVVERNVADDGAVVIDDEVIMGVLGIQPPDDESQRHLSGI